MDEAKKEKRREGNKPRTKFIFHIKRTYSPLNLVHNYVKIT